MKRKRRGKKLHLTRTTITRLTDQEMENINGGLSGDSRCGTCGCPTDTCSCICQTTTYYTVCTCK